MPTETADEADEHKRTVFMDDPVWVAFGKEAELRAEAERTAARRDARQIEMLEGIWPSD